jgi:hypothetical protein
VIDFKNTKHCMFGKGYIRYNMLVSVNTACLVKGNLNYINNCRGKTLCKHICMLVKLHSTLPLSTHLIHEQPKLSDVFQVFSNVLKVTEISYEGTITELSSFIHAITFTSFLVLLLQHR